MLRQEAAELEAEARLVKAAINTVRVLPAFNVAVQRDPKDSIQIARSKLPVCAMEQARATGWLTGWLAGGMDGWMDG